MRARRITAAQLKDRRNKKIAAALLVVFIGVCVVQVPKLMKQLNPKTTAVAPPAATTPPPSGTPSSGATSATPASASTLTAAAPGQLHAFARLPLKDPFKSLVSATPPATSAPKATAPAPKPTPKPQPKLAGGCSIVINNNVEALVCSKKKPVKAGKASQQQPAQQQPATGTVPFKAAPPPPNAAVVKINGLRQVVFVGDGFPRANPLFKLVSLGDKTIRVGVLSGSFTSGLPTIKLAKGKRVTLANEVDGSRYVIKLVALTTATPPPATTTPASTTPASTTPSTTTPTSTTAPPAAATTASNTTTH